MCNTQLPPLAGSRVQAGVMGEELTSAYRWGEAPTARSFITPAWSPALGPNLAHSSHDPGWGQLAREGPACRWNSSMHACPSSVESIDAVDPQRHARFPVFQSIHCDMSQTNDLMTRFRSHSRLGSKEEKIGPSQRHYTMVKTNSRTVFTRPSLWWFDLGTDRGIFNRFCPNAQVVSAEASKMQRTSALTTCASGQKDASIRLHSASVRLDV